MGRATGLLSARKAATLKQPGRHADGGNLYLSISENGGRRWVLLYTLNGKRREMGLGSAADGQVSLAVAREQASEARRLLHAGIDPLADKQARKQAERPIPTFGAFADDYLASHRPKFRNEKHAAQWEMTLTTYCQPIRSLPVDAIDTEAVLKVLQPIWTEIPETASRLRGRIENVLDAAKARGYFHGENPARWRGHLKALLPARQRLTRGHHAALPYDDLPDFIAALRARQSLAAMALELCILTATRSGEIIKAKWSELDLDKAVWTIPARRMKAGYEHRVPLSLRAMQILKSLPKVEHTDYVFPGQRPRQAAVINGDGNAASPHESCRHHRARLPFDFPGLGFGADIISARDLRARPGASYQRQGGSRLPARRPVRKAPQADGSLGYLLRTSKECQSRSD